MSVVTECCYLRMTRIAVVVAAVDVEVNEIPIVEYIPHNFDNTEVCCKEISKINKILLNFARSFSLMTNDY